VVRDLGQRVETIDRGEDFAAFLGQQCFGGATNGLAIVDDQDLETREPRLVRCQIFHRFLVGHALRL
jgi:hypothetical protein